MITAEIGKDSKVPVETSVSPALESASQESSPYKEENVSAWQRFKDSFKAAETEAVDNNLSTVESPTCVPQKLRLNVN